MGVFLKFAVSSRQWAVAFSSKPIASRRAAGQRMERNNEARDAMILTSLNTLSTRNIIQLHPTKKALQLQRLF
jgi:hypothetical protein